MEKRNILLIYLIFFRNKIIKAKAIINNTKIFHRFHIPVNNMFLRHQVNFEIRVYPFLCIQLVERIKRNTFQGLLNSKSSQIIMQVNDIIKLFIFKNIYRIEKI